MRKALGLAALASATALIATPAQAGDMEGKLQVKAMGSAVLTDGNITDVNLAGPVPAGTQTESNDNFVPTVAIEYFFTSNISLETICCVTQHDVDATAGPLDGAELVSDAKVIPATFTLKYHVNPGGISPYIGAGPTYFIWIDDDPGAATIPLGVTKQTMSNELGFALQAGIDIPMGDDGLGLSLDAKRYFVDTTARWYAGSTKVIETEHELDPWVLSAGVSYRF